MSGYKIKSRKELLRAVWQAGFHNDQRAGCDLLLENAVSVETYTKWWDAGRVARRAGEPCDCVRCKVERMRNNPPIKELQVAAA
jgi:hypothetical protein